MIVQEPPTVSAPQPTPNYYETSQAPAMAVIQAIVTELFAEATRRVSIRLPLELDWIDDLQQFNGVYDEGTMKRLKDNSGSEIYVNLTRPKTTTMAARLKETLFPTTDRNWDIKPTPVPKLTQSAAKVAGEALAAEQEAVAAEQAAAAGGDPALQERAAAARQTANVAKDLQKKYEVELEEGRKRSDLMKLEMEDQLVECDYTSIKRRQIDWACKLGTGVTKGPVTGEKVRRGWKQPTRKKQVQGPDGQIYQTEEMDDLGMPVREGEHYLDISHGEEPGFREVNLWDFFPDPDVFNIADSNGVFERHLLSAPRLRRLQHLKGFDKNAIRRLLMRGPGMNAPAYLALLRNIRGATTTAVGPLFQVWEYTGPLAPEQIRELALHTKNKAAFDQIIGPDGSVDPLIEMQVVVWFSDNEVLKFEIHPYDSGECYYSVYNLFKDDASIFGYGMPRIIRDPQAAINAANRALLDNAGIASGPQIIVNTNAVTPADGEMRFGGRKMWLAREGWQKENPPVQVIQIDGYQPQLQAIAELFERYLDMMSGVPQLASGEQGSNVTKTAQGMALLMNSTNIVLREPVKNFDIDVTERDLRMLYDWNMQFNPKEGIKGDFDVKAIGSSVLLVREIQAQNLMTLALQFGAHPIFGPMLRNRDLLRKVFQSHMIDSGEVMLTDEQIDAVLAQAAKQAEEMAKAAQMPLEIEKLRHEQKMKEMEKDAEIENMKRDTLFQIERMRRDTEMMKLAAQANIKLEDIKAMLDDKQADRDHKERLFAAEAAIEDRMADKNNAAAIEQTTAKEKAKGNGSGGYLSQ